MLSSELPPNLLGRRGKFDTMACILHKLKVESIMRIVEKAYTFDDVLLVPAHSQVLPRDVSLKTRLTRQIALNLPLLSAAMDTVTEARLAISMAQEGGLGIIHKNMSPDMQAKAVGKVKRHESGVVKDPVTVASFWNCARNANAKCPVCRSWKTAKWSAS